MWKPITVEKESEIHNRFIESTKTFDLDKYIDYLYEWIPDRIDFCDSYFNYTR